MTTFETVPRHRLRLPRGFIEPCAPSLVALPPSGPLWLHEIKRDGYRIMAHRDGGDVRLWSRSGKDWASRLTGIVDGVLSLPVTSVILDGEAVVVRPDGYDDFHALRSTFGCREAFLVAFDILALNGEDLRPLPLEARRAVLSGVLPKAGSRIPMSEVLHDDGPAVFRAACRLRLEGIISKRRDMAYRSGRSLHWLKSKNSDYDRRVQSSHVA